MNAFEKAVAAIEAEKAKSGAYPVDILLVKYDDPFDFNLAFPGESFADHEEQVINLVDWCRVRKIKIKRVPFDPERMKGGKDNRAKRARAAVLPDYRLGLEIHSTAVAAMMVQLSQPNSRGHRQPTKIGMPEGKMKKL